MHWTGEQPETAARTPSLRALSMASRMRLAMASATEELVSSMRKHATTPLSPLEEW